MNEADLSPYTLRDLADWYEAEATRRRVGIKLDQNALDRDLRLRIADHGVPPEFISAEFERVMQVVFPGSKPQPAEALNEPKAPGKADDADDADGTAALAWLSPAVHTAFMASPDGAVEVRLRQPDDSWSSPLTARSPRFAAPRRLSLPTCTGWCSGCCARSTWRHDPPAPNAVMLRWCCVRCECEPSP